MTKKTLIVYGTRKGMTAKSAEIIAEVLRTKFKHEVDVLNLKKTRGKISIQDYHNIIIGSGIAMGFWVGKVKRFLKHDFSDKKVSVFVCSGLAGDALLADDKEKHQNTIERYINKPLSKVPALQPVAKMAFGGRWIKKDGAPVVDNWKKEHVEQWANELGKLL